MASKTSAKSRVGSKIGLGLALLLLGAILVFGRPEKIVDLSNYTFEKEPVKVVGLTAASEGTEESQPRRVIVPGLSIDLKVRRARVVNDYWEVFPDMAGWGEGSGVPGESGNQVIFAHAREGLFLPLSDVKKGMRVYVLTESTLNLSTLPEELAEAFRKETGEEVLRRSNWYGYEVVEIKEVYPYETEVIEPTQDETLTLYTCSGFSDSKRLIVVAKRT